MPVDATPRIERPRNSNAGPKASAEQSAVLRTGSRANARYQVVLGVLACVLVGVVFLFAGGELLIFALMLGLLLVFGSPSVLILSFICFSYFRIHEAYTILLPLKLPLLFSLASLATIAYGITSKTVARTERATFWVVPALLATSIAALILLIVDIESHGYADRFPTFLAVVFAALAIYSCYRLIEGLSGMPWGLEAKLFVAFAIVVTLGVPFARNPTIALLYWNATYWKIIAMTIVLVWCLRNRTDFSAAIWLLVSSGILIAGMTIHNWYFGIDLVEGTRVTIGRTLFSTPQDIENAEPGMPIPGGSLLGDPNDLALVLLFPLGFALATLVRLRLTRSLGWLCLVALPLIVTAIIMTQSRGGALGMLAVFGVVGLYHVRSKLIILALGAGLAVSVAGAMDLGSRQSGGLEELSEAGIDNSALERIYAWTAAVNMTTTYPVRGVGIKNFSSQFRIFSPKWVGRNMDVHSTWLGVMAETGLPGLGLFVTIIVMVLVSLRRSWRQLQRMAADPIYLIFCMALIAGLAGFCVSGTFLTQGFTWPIYLIIGFSIALKCVVANLSAEGKGAEG